MPQGHGTIRWMQLASSDGVHRVEHACMSARFALSASEHASNLQRVIYGRVYDMLFLCQDKVPYLLLNYL